MRVSTWINKDYLKNCNPTNDFVSNGIPIFKALTEKFWKMPECELVNLDILADSKENFFCSDGHNCKNTRPNSPQVLGKAGSVENVSITSPKIMKISI